MFSSFVKSKKTHLTAEEISNFCISKSKLFYHAAYQISVTEFMNAPIFLLMFSFLHFVVIIPLHNFCDKITLLIEF